MQSASVAWRVWSAVVFLACSLQLFEACLAADEAPDAATCECEGIGVKPWDESQRFELGAFEKTQCDTLAFAPCDGPDAGATADPFTPTKQLGLCNVKGDWESLGGCGVDTQIDIRKVQPEEEEDLFLQGAVINLAWTRKGVAADDFVYTVQCRKKKRANPATWELGSFWSPLLSVPYYALLVDDVFGEYSCRVKYLDAKVPAILLRKFKVASDWQLRGPGWFAQLRTSDWSDAFQLDPWLQANTSDKERARQYFPVLQSAGEVSGKWPPPAFFWHDALEGWSAEYWPWPNEDSLDGFSFGGLYPRFDGTFRVLKSQTGEGESEQVTLRAKANDQTELVALLQDVELESAGMSGAAVSWLDLPSEPVVSGGGFDIAFALQPWGLVATPDLFSSLWADLVVEGEGEGGVACADGSGRRCWSHLRVVANAKERSGPMSVQQALPEVALFMRSPVRRRSSRNMDGDLTKEARLAGALVLTPYLHARFEAVPLALLAAKGEHGLTISFPWHFRLAIHESFGTLQRAGLCASANRDVVGKPVVRFIDPYDSSGDAVTLIPSEESTAKGAFVDSAFPIPPAQEAEHVLYYCTESTCYNRLLPSALGERSGFSISGKTSQRWALLEAVFPFASPSYTGVGARVYGPPMLILQADEGSSVRGDDGTWRFTLLVGGDLCKNGGGEKCQPRVSIDAFMFYSGTDHVGGQPAGVTPAAGRAGWFEVAFHFGCLKRGSGKVMFVAGPFGGVLESLRYAESSTRKDEVPSEFREQVRQSLAHTVLKEWDVAVDEKCADLCSPVDREQCTKPNFDLQDLGVVTFFHYAESLDEGVGPAKECGDFRVVVEHSGDMPSPVETRKIFSSVETGSKFCQAEVQGLQVCTKYSYRFEQQEGQDFTTVTTVGGDTSPSPTFTISASRGANSQDGATVPELCLASAREPFVKLSTCGDSCGPKGVDYLKDWASRNLRTDYPRCAPLDTGCADYLSLLRTCRHNRRNIEVVTTSNRVSDAHFSVSVREGEVELAQVVGIKLANDSDFGLSVFVVEDDLRLTDPSSGDSSANSNSADQANQAGMADQGFPDDLLLEPAAGPAEPEKPRTIVALPNGAGAFGETALFEKLNSVPYNSLVVLWGAVWPQKEQWTDFLQNVCGVDAAELKTVEVAEKPLFTLICFLYSEPFAGAKPSVGWFVHSSFSKTGLNTASRTFPLFGDVAGCEAPSDREDKAGDGAGNGEGDGEGTGGPNQSDIPTKGTGSGSDGGNDALGAGNGQKAPGNDESSSSLFVVIGGVAGGVVVILIIIFTIVIMRQRRKHREMKRLSSQASSLGMPYTTDKAEEALFPVELNPLSKSDANSQSGPLVLPQEKVICNSSDPWEMDKKLITMGEKIGMGEFGEVFLGTVAAGVRGRAEGIQRVAIKTLKEGSNTQMQLDFLKEARLSLRFAHPNVVNCLATCTSSQPFWILLEFCAKGSLRKRLVDLDEAGSLPFEVDPTEMLSFALQIARGMAYLASRQVIHRDLAARNVLLDICDEGEAGGSSAVLICKIADFGISRTLDIADYYKQSDTKVKLPIRWMAVESLGKQRWSTKSDVWSFGVVLFEMFSLADALYPTIRNQDLLPSLRAGERLPKPRRASDEVYAMMTQCWSEAPSDRPDFDVLVKEFDAMLDGRDGAFRRRLFRALQAGEYVEFEESAFADYIDVDGEIDLGMACARDYVELADD